MKPEKLDIRQAMRSPKDTFGTPERVLADPRLDREGKRAILKSWEQDARKIPVAEEDGMVGGERTMLERVLRALRTVSGIKVENEERADEQDGQVSESEAEPTEVETLPLVKDLMRPTDEVVHVDQKLREAYVRMLRFQVPFLPVVDGDEIVGVLTARDIYSQPQANEKGIKAARVRDHLSRDIAFCYADDDVEMAKEVMQESGRHRLLVTDDQEHLVGLITLEAITAALREHGPRRPSEPQPEAAERIAETAAGRAKGDQPGQPKSYAVKPKIKK